MTEREKTNSITHLVKIVANEVISERLTPLIEKIKKVEGSQYVVHCDAQELLAEIQNAFENRGATWVEQEDAILREEVQLALHTIAKNHGRSTTAIAMRIKDRKLI